jgi:hypothetical protein
MRRILALLLLTVQLQPVVGSVFCFATAGVEHPMASMPGMDEDTPPSRPAGTAVLDVAGAPLTAPGCPLVQACSPLVIAILSTGTARPDPDPTHAVAILSAGPVPALDSRAPPTPPPNL